MKGGLAAEPMGLEEYGRGRGRMIAESASLPLDVELRAQVQRESRDLLKCCRKAAKRRAPPHGEYP
eukprot:1682203-Pyramimonas_sp.AAC.1